MGTMLIPDRTGHTTVAWRQGDAAGEAAAAERFATLLSERMTPFVHLGAQQYEPLPAFDPTADEILWVRPLQGG